MTITIGEKNFEMTRYQIVGGFVEANTDDDLRKLAMAGAFMIQDNFNNGDALINLSRDRVYYIIRKEGNVTVGRKGVGGGCMTLPLTKARKFVAALGQFAECDFMDSDRVLYFNKMALAI